jgi:hypothetical protein
LLHDIVIPVFSRIGPRPRPRWKIQSVVTRQRPEFSAAVSSLLPVVCYQCRRSECPLWVKSGQAATDQNPALSAITPIADKRWCGWIVRFVPIAGHSAIHSITSSTRVSRAGTIREGLRRAKATRDQPRLEPASAAVPSAAKHQNDDYNDEKRGGIHM